MESVVHRACPEARVEMWNSSKEGQAQPNLGGRRAWLELFWRGPIRRELKAFDVVIDTRSGDSFTEIYGLSRHMRMCLIAKLAARSAPLVLAPQTIGPFDSWLGRCLARWSARRAVRVYARDSHSVAVGSTVLARDVGLATDVVFALDPAPHSVRHDVILNVSGLLWEPNPHVDHALYRDWMWAFLDQMVVAKRRVSLLAHVVASDEADSDGGPLQALAHHPAVETLLEPNGLGEARQMIAGGEVVVGARMHACLNALSQGIPAVPLEYSDKFAPLMHDLGWSHHMDLRLESFDVEALVSKISDPRLKEEAIATQRRGTELLNPFSDFVRASLCRPDPVQG